MLEQNALFKNARWIGHTRIAGRKVGILTPTLRAIKNFMLDSVPKTATVRVSGLGSFVLYINGNRVGDEVLSPAFTDYQKTVLFCEYDVTELLKAGKNTVAIEVGAGFFNQATDDVWSFAHANWRDGEKFILTLSADGQEVLVSDKTWLVDTNGPRYHSQIRQGEYYDATREDGWLSEGFTPVGWHIPTLVSPPGGVMRRQELPPIRICEVLKPVSRKIGKNGVIFNFGKNIAGVCRVKMKAPKGTEMKINYGELLTESGDEVSKYGITMHVKCEEQYTDKYTFRGEGVEEFKPEFVYHGFQFAEVVGAAPELDEIEALFIHTDLRDKGSFNSSDDMYNWVANASITAFLSNFHGFSEDCPHREKNGWTGDAVISAHHAVYRYDMKEAYKKWLRDIAETQLQTGQLSCIAPTAGWGYVWGCGPAWDCALFALPEALYRETGDTECFDLIFDTAVKYLEYAKDYEDEGGLVCFGLADWCPPRDDNGEKYPVASNEFSDSCHYIMMLRIMKLMCDLKGEPCRGELYEKRAERVLSSVREKYVKGDDVDNSTASARAMAIYYGIVEGAAADALADKLAEQIKAAGYTTLTGILGMKALFSALSDHGHIDTVNKFVHCDDYPSYGYMRKNGATALWEAWDTKTASRNHHMYSEVLNWLYRYVGGIRNDGIAYDKCTIAPYIFDTESSASTSTETPRGTLSVDWKYSGGKFTATVTVPEGTKAKIKVLGTEKELACGTQTVEINA
ncbi:MAG: family 78 glycoside hydrolase catalytic domain [Clostridia bacterium]|nr:family 78 glycoside hydrolase catalytic domain [Clostridia bacterium]